MVFPDHSHLLFLVCMYVIIPFLHETVNKSLFKLVTKCINIDIVGILPNVSKPIIKQHFIR